MSDFQITPHVSPPNTRMGRPILERWRNFKSALESAKELAKDEWAAVALPPNASVLYATRLAKLAGFKVGTSEKANEIKVLYVGQC